MNKLYNDDCFNILSSIEDNSVDFIVIDPPYGFTASTWDKKINLNELWKEFNRIGKKNYVAAVFSCQPFTTELISSNKKFKYCWYWIKNQATNFFHAKSMPLRKVEEICIFGGTKYNPQITEGHVPTNSSKGGYNGTVYYGKNKRNYSGGETTRFPTNVLNFKCVNNYHRVHPNEKPLELYEYLIKTYTDENDVILDCFFGSGNSILAAKKLNRNYIGIEKENKYFNILFSKINSDKLSK